MLHWWGVGFFSIGCDITSLVWFNVHEVDSRWTAIDKRDIHGFSLCKAFLGSRVNFIRKSSLVNQMQTFGEMKCSVVHYFSWPKFGKFIKKNLKIFRGSDWNKYTKSIKLHTHIRNPETQDLREVQRELRKIGINWGTFLTRCWRRCWRETNNGHISEYWFNIYWWILIIYRVFFVCTLFVSNHTQKIESIRTSCFICEKWISAIGKTGEQEPSKLQIITLIQKQMMSALFSISWLHSTHLPHNNTNKQHWNRNENPIFNEFPSFYSCWSVLDRSIFSYSPKNINLWLRVALTFTQELYKYKLCHFSQKILISYIFVQF